MLKTTELVHLLIKNHVCDDDIVIDATCGNGQDTLFLASLVPNGKVLAYDIQQSAIENTKKRTSDYHNIQFFLESHEFINVENCKLVLFNLGFLPNGDKSITTKSFSTINAVKNLVASFEKNPKMTIYLIVYPGHEEGKKESTLLNEYVESLDKKHYFVMEHKPINQNNAPYLLTISLKH